VVVDTSYFVGNYPPYVSVEGCSVTGHPDPSEIRDANWETLVARSPVKGDTRNVFEVDGPRRYTHVRLRMHPDGGVARLRVHGEAIADPQWFADLPTDLVALANGGAVVACSDWFFSPPHHMLQPGESRYMSDGWESRRRRDDGHDWAVLRLFAEGTPRVLELDTTHYKGNAPDTVSLLGARISSDDPDTAEWFELLRETRLQPDASHRFRLPGDRAVTHVRLEVYPDGGVGRLRLYGPLTQHGEESAQRRWAQSQAS
jgi:allantoicase